MGTCYGGNGGAEIPLTATETSDWRRLAARRRSGDHIGRAGYRAGEGVRRNFQILPVTIYSPTLSVWPSGTTRWHRDAKLYTVVATRCDWKVQIGCTEIENLDQLNDLGRTESGVSVRPRIIKRFWKFKSMTNRGLRALLTQSGSNLTWSNFVMQHE